MTVHRYSKQSDVIIMHIIIASANCTCLRVDFGQSPAGLDPTLLQMIMIDLYEDPRGEGMLGQAHNNSISTYKHS